MVVLPDAANRRKASGLALVLALALVLLLAQFLGQTHGSVHGSLPGTVPGTMPNMARGHAEVHSHGHSQVNDHGQSASSVFAHLFSGHEDDSDDCHAFDQLSHIDAMPGVAALALPLVIQPFLLSISSGLATARWHALFQARGPPSLR